MRNVLVIGASRGIGRAVAERLAGDHAVWTASRHPADHDRHLHWDATGGALPGDGLPKRLHGLVYCPGSVTLGPFERLGDDTWQSDFDVNVLGAVRAIRAALPALRATEGASVVLLSSVAASAGMAMHASIAAAKGAVEGMVHALAAEFAPRVRVNAVAPSLTDTPLTARLLRTQALRVTLAARHPAGRIGEADDVAAAICFLLSGDADWITGQVLHVDGGMGSLRLFDRASA